MRLELVILAVVLVVFLAFLLLKDKINTEGVLYEASLGGEKDAEGNVISV